MPIAITRGRMCRDSIIQQIFTLTVLFQIPVELKGAAHVLETGEAGPAATAALKELSIHRVGGGQSCQKFGPL